MRAWLVEYHWTEDTSMDPHARSGDEDRYARAIFIPGETENSGVLVFMACDVPIFRKVGSAGNSLFGSVGIPCTELDFTKIKSIVINSNRVDWARRMADQADLIWTAQSAYRLLFEAITK